MGEGGGNGERRGTGVLKWCVGGWGWVGAEGVGVYGEGTEVEGGEAMWAGRAKTVAVGRGWQGTCGGLAGWMTGKGWCEQGWCG